MGLDVVIKFGGSVVTHKHEDTPTINQKCIDKLANDLKIWLADHPETRVCIVHGTFGCQ